DLVADLLRVHANVVLTRPLRLGAELLEEREHRVDVADARDVRQLDGLVGEQARGEDRQDAVLVARRAKPSLERMPALDHERLGDRPGDGRGHGRTMLARLWS